MHMKNFCQRPEIGKILYHCGFEIEENAVGICKFAHKDCLYMSRCEHYAMGCCLNKMAQIDADMSMSKEREKKHE